jgi:hypothetical protein
MRHDPDRHARQRLAYWDRRIADSERGRDSRDPAFVDLAHRLRRMWVGKLTQYVLDRAA